MRIRYGKPIKVKSLVGKQDVLTFNSQGENISYIGVGDHQCVKQGSAYIRNIGAGVNVTLNSEHKYFICMKIKGTLNNISFSIYYANDTTQIALDAAQYRNLQDKTVCTLLTNETKFRASHLYTWKNSFDVTSFAEYYFLIDLTEIGLDNLTAQEFYNKYNQYFPLIATGEEITIDDKAGQVSLGPRLPLEYQEVEYIEGDGGQYMSVINNLNDKSIDGNLTVGYKFQVTVHDRAMYFSTIEASMSAGQTYSLGYIVATGHLYIRWNQIANSTTEVTGYQVGDILEITRTNNVQTTLKRYSLFTHGDSKSLTWKGRIYKYWLKLNDEYLFNWIPCYRKSDNVIGLYDLISKTFTTNIGTGTFLKGNSINNTISCKIAGGSSDIYYGYNQLAELPETTGTKWKGYNCTMTAENGVATCVANGNNYPALASQFYNIIYELDHIYMHLAKFKQDTAVTGGAFGINTNGMSTKLSGNSTTIVGEWIDLYFFSRGQGASTYTNTFNIQGGSNAVSGATFYVKDCICIDLTDWFGPGKEPTTIQEFKERFAKEYYGFCPTPIKLTRYQIEALPSYGYNQVVNNGNFADNLTNWSKVNITAEKQSNNFIKILPSNLTSKTANYNRLAQGSKTFQNNHKLFISCECYSSISGSRLNFSTWSGTINKSAFNKTFTLQNAPQLLEDIVVCGENIYATNHDLRIGFSNGDASLLTDIYYIRNIYVIDLTDWYGEGNEPATVEEFKQTFLNKYYPYSKKRILNKYMINKLEN